MDQGNESQSRQGYLYAVRLLTASKKSGNELKKRLLQKGYEAEIVEQIIAKLQSQQLLNDRKLVTDTIQWATEGKRIGRNRIIYELTRRGIDRSVIDEALEQVPSDRESELAETLAQERWTRLGQVEFRKKKKRVYDYLVNRGFQFDLCRDVVSKLHENAHENS